jgi:hypothetical protein
LFVKFVWSNKVKDLISLIFVKVVVLSVCNNVFPHEEWLWYFKRHALFHLESHTNCGQGSTKNGERNCASHVMPQSLLEQTIKTLNLNTKNKAKNTSIMVCNKTNCQKLWSDSPTSAHITDPCKSMSKMEWKRATDWIFHCLLEWRWLIIYQLDKVGSSMSDWSYDKADSDEVTSNEAELDMESPVLESSQNKMWTYSKLFCLWSHGKQ